MKKAVYFMCVLLLLLSITGCSQKQVNHNAILGSWETETEMSLLGVSESVEENQTIDVIYNFEFREDGTGETGIIVDEQYVGYISNKNAGFTYILDGDSLELTYEDGNICSRMKTHGTSF